MNKLNKKKPLDDIHEAKINSSNSIVTNNKSDISYDIEKDDKKNIVTETDIVNRPKESSVKKDNKISENSRDSGDLKIEIKWEWHNLKSTKIWS